MENVSIVLLLSDAALFLLCENTFYRLSQLGHAAFARPADQLLWCIFIDSESFLFFYNSPHPTSKRWATFTEYCWYPGFYLPLHCLCQFLKRLKWKSCFLTLNFTVFTFWLTQNTRSRWSATRWQGCKAPNSTPALSYVHTGKDLCVSGIRFQC